MCVFACLCDARAVGLACALGVVGVEAISQAISCAEPLKIKVEPATAAASDDGRAGSPTSIDGGGDGGGGGGGASQPAGDMVELTRDEYRALRAALAKATGPTLMKSMTLTPADRPYYIDFDDHKVWLNEKLYGSFVNRGLLGSSQVTSPARVLPSHAIHPCLVD